MRKFRIIKVINILSGVFLRNSPRLNILYCYHRRRKREQMTETYLAQAVEAVGAEGTYDTNVKYLLADRQILARILKYTMRDFQDMPVAEIMSCIGDDIEVAAVPVDPGLTNLGRVSESNSEDNVPGEGKIFYDIRFCAYNRETEMKFLINLEAQRSSDPGKLGYHLQNRILFYMARMISAQKQTEFYGSDYDDLKKVRSIWICFAQGEDGDSIEEINLERKTVFGKMKSTHGIDLMQGIIVNIRDEEKIEDSANELISMLEELFSRTDVVEKKRILAEKFDLIMTEELEGRVQVMCNWSQHFMEKGIEQGIEKGIEQGIEKGIEQGTRQAIIDLLEDLGSVPEDICNRIFVENNVEILRKWLKYAARTESFECFRERIL